MTEELNYNPSQKCREISRQITSQAAALNTKTAAQAGLPRLNVDKNSEEKKP